MTRNLSKKKSARRMPSDAHLSRMANRLKLDRTTFMMSLTVKERALLDDAHRQTNLSRSAILRQGLQLAVARLLSA